jgi:hypothetical protein
MGRVAAIASGTVSNVSKRQVIGYLSFVSPQIVFIRTLWP